MTTFDGVLADVTDSAEVVEGYIAAAYYRALMRSGQNDAGVRAFGQQVRGFEAVIGGAVDRAGGWPDE